MKLFEFEFEVDFIVSTAVALDALHDAGCTDSVLVEADGVRTLRFARYAPCLSMAMADAHAEVKSSGVVKHLIVKKVKGEW